MAFHYISFRKITEYFPELKCFGRDNLLDFSLLLHGDGLWTKEERRGEEEEGRRERGDTRSEAGEAAAGRIHFTP